MNFRQLGFAFVAADERTWQPFGSRASGLGTTSLSDFPWPDPLADYRERIRDEYLRFRAQERVSTACAPPPPPRGGRRA